MTTYESASEDLITAVDHVIEGWLVRITRNRLSDHLSVITTDVDAEIAAAAREARSATIARLREVIFADVDAQAANPLQVLRQAVDLPAAVLRRAGVPVVERDEFDARINPNDVYALYPAHWSDIDESLTEPGIVWGAAKAATVLQRRRAEGKLEP